MASEQTLFEYSHSVRVSAESGEVLGPGHFAGTARINRVTGGPRRSGDIHTNIDPLVLVAAGTLCLEFDNGAVGYARWTNSSINAWWSVVRCFWSGHWASASLRQLTQDAHSPNISRLPPRSPFSRLGS